MTDPLRDAFIVKYGVDTDTDTDNLTDDLETYQYATNASNPDSDYDGIPDGAELQLLLNPLNFTDSLDDPDQDLLINRAEYFNGTDIRDPDSDHDGLLDGAEVLIYRTNPLNSDSDDDTYSDSEEVNAGTDPLDPSSYPSPAIYSFQFAWILVSILLLIPILKKNKK